MAGTLSPTTPPAAYPVHLVCPLNTEPLDASQEQTLDQALLDGVENARLMAYGTCQRVTTCANGADITAAPLGAISVWNGSAWLVFPSLINLSYTPGALAASSRFYLYAYNAAGALALTHNATGPDAGRFYMTGNTAYAYVGTFITDGAGAIVPYTQAGRQYTYLEYGSDNRILNIGSATVETAVPFGITVPTGASAAMLRASWASTVVTTAIVRTNTSASNIMAEETTSTGTGSTGFFPVSLAAGNGVRYLVGNAAASLTLHVAEFTF